jgi:hypothetical protein
MPTPGEAPLCLLGPGGDFTFPWPDEPAPLAPQETCGSLASMDEFEAHDELYRDSESSVMPIVCPQKGGASHVR